MITRRTTDLHGLAPATSLPPAEEPAQANTSIDALAESICSRGYGSAAVFLLESVRPLNFIGSQLLYALGPIASVVIDGKKLEGLAETLEDRDSIDRLIRTIEARESPPSSTN